jgi:hypothetical protein
MAENNDQDPFKLVAIRLFFDDRPEKTTANILRLSLIISKCDLAATILKRQHSSCKSDGVTSIEQCE